MTNPYKEVKSLLLRNNIVIHDTVIITSSGKELCDGLWCWCNPLLKEKRLEKVRELLPHNFTANYFSGLEEIHIKMVI